MIVEGNPKERSPLYLKRAKFPLGEDRVLSRSGAKKIKMKLKGALACSEVKRR